VVTHPSIQPHKAEKNIDIIDINGIIDAINQIPCVKKNASLMSAAA
jgi:hypothetical protein